MSFFEYLIFGIYPYAVLTVFIVVSLLRFFYLPLSWKTSSSELLENNQLKIGNNLFHIGILALFFGHLGGLLIPHYLFILSGLTDKTHQIIEIYAGSISGAICFVGLIILIIRRFFNDYIYRTSTVMDLVILLWLILTLTAGLMSIPYSYFLDPSGAWLVDFGKYAQGIIQFKANAPYYLNSMPLIYKLHIFMGLTVFLLLPFSRLVHIFSGFAIIFAYPMRAFQLVRRLPNI